MRIAVPGAGRPVARRLRRAAVACLLLAVVVVVGTWNGLLLIVARHVIPGWVVSGTLIVATLGAAYHVQEPSGPAAVGLLCERRPSCSPAVATYTPWPQGGSADAPVPGAATTVTARSPPAPMNWAGADNGNFAVNGSDVDPVWPALHEIDCR